MSLVTLEPDMSVEPGHQWIVLPDNEEGWALLTLLGCYNQPTIKRGNEILVAHDQQVDRTIVQLIDQLANVRFSAPELIQLSMIEAIAEDVAP